MPAVADDVTAEILDLKEKIGATILAHYYQEGEIQAIADITGDSLKLAREATKVDSPVIVFCGVLFMAETAKMLNPSKKVLLPDLEAGCSLVDSCPPEKLAPLPGDAPRERPQVPDRHLHQQLGQGEGALRLGGDQRQRRGGRAARCRRTTRSCSSPTSTSAGIYKKSPGGR